MQGFIIQITPQKNESVIVQILSPKKIIRLYRFYGARHSIIQLGKKVDFEMEYQTGFLPKMRNITPINFRFEYELARLYIWQSFIQLLHRHCIDIEEIDGFYYDMLELGAHKMQLQNPMRVVLEMYVSLLNFEGRLSNFSECFLCGRSLGDELSLGRAFLPAHPSCMDYSGSIFIYKDIIKLFETLNSIHLDDDKVALLYKIIQLGI